MSPREPTTMITMDMGGTGGASVGGPGAASTSLACAVSQDGAWAKQRAAWSKSILSAPPLPPRRSRPHAPPPHAGVDCGAAVAGTRRRKHPRSLLSRVQPLRRPFSLLSSGGPFRCSGTTDASGSGGRSSLAEAAVDQDPTKDPLIQLVRIPHGSADVHLHEKGVSPVNANFTLATSS